MGLREGGARLVQTAHLLEDRVGLAQQDGIAGQAEDKIDPSPMGQHLAHFGVATWLFPRTRMWVRGQCRRRTARRRTKIMAFSLPGGRVPGRKQAVTKACEGPSKMKSGT
jgi:hypothetical protein